MLVDAECDGDWRRLDKLEDGVLPPLNNERAVHRSASTGSQRGEARAATPARLFHRLSLRRRRNMRMKNPPHPGLHVRHDWLEPLKLSVPKGAEVLGVTRKRSTIC